MEELAHYVRLKPLLDNTVVRTVLFARDFYRCGYCYVRVSFQTGTLDHYIPKDWFRKHPERKVAEASTWQNMLLACRPCNEAKTNHLPRDCGMYPAFYPFKPDVVRTDFPGVTVRPIQPQLVHSYLTKNLQTGEWLTSKSPPDT